MNASIGGKKDMSKVKKSRAQPGPGRGLVKLDIYDPFVNQLTAYFGDDDDVTAIAVLRADIAKSRHVRLLWRKGLRDALADPAPVNRVRLVKHYANRSVYSDEEARAWLASVQHALFRE